MLLAHSGIIAKLQRFLRNLHYSSTSVPINSSDRQIFSTINMVAILNKQINKELSLQPIKIP